MEAVETKKQSFISFPEKWRLELCFGLYLFASGYAFNLFGLWIKFAVGEGTLEQEYEGWFISLKNNFLIANWGTKVLSMWMPWDYVMIKCDVLTADQTWASLRKQKIPHFSKLMNQNEFKDDRAMFEAPYRYLTGSNKVQTTTARFYVTRSFFKWRILQRSTYGKTKTRIDLNITFENQVGDNVGRWRGGVIKCLFEMDSSDSNPFHAFNRFQRTKRFG